MRNFPVTEFSVTAIRIFNPSDQRSYPTSFSDTEIQGQTHHKTHLGITSQGGEIRVVTGELSSDIYPTLRLLVHRMYSVIWYDSISNTGSNISFEIPGNSIPEGIVQFSLLSDDNTVLASQLWSDYNLETHLADIQLNEKNFHIRGKYQAEYQIDKTIEPDSNLLIFSTISLDQPGNSTGDLIPGLPGWNFGTMIPGNKKLFQEWLNRNNYPDDCVKAFFEKGSKEPVSPEKLNLPDLSRPGINYFPEISERILCGRVADRKSGIGIPSVGVGVTILNDNSFEAIKTNGNGLFYFAFPGILTSRDYILTFISQPDSGWAIDIIPEYDTRKFSVPARAFFLTDDELLFVQNLNINLQLNQVYGQPVPTDTSHSALLRRKPFYTPPDRTILTDRYIELANVGEVVYEVVPDVQVHRSGLHAWLSVYNDQPNAPDYETLVLLDGIPLTDQKELLDLPPDRIKSIEVKNKIFIHGNYIFSSIVNFISRNGDFAGLKLPPQSIVGSFEGLTGVVQPTTSVTESGHLPVIRDILLQNTKLLSGNGKINFSTNDLYGDFTIRIFGFDNHGGWIFGQKTFTVKALE